MPRRGTESEFELTTIERLVQLGYVYAHGSELLRPPEEVVLHDRLRASLRRRYPDLPAAAVEEAVRRFARPEGVDTLRRNLAFHQLLRHGIDDLRIEHPDGQVEHRHVYAVDWEDPDANDFLVVNQLAIKGQNDRRPDLVVYLNGLPVVVFELKNPWEPEATAEGAYNQIQHYRHDIPQLFDTNGFVVVSDQVTTLHGVWSAGREHYAPWKSIDDDRVEAATSGSMKTLLEGLFRRDRLLAYLRDFLLFEVVADRVTKKGAKYHQFFAVRRAVERTLAAYRAPDERRIGVIWHTTGSGKSLAMAFLVGILRRLQELENPTFVVQVDRTDLDNQLHDQFVAARSLVGDVQQAESVDELRGLLRGEGGEVIFTTLEKFRLKRGSDGQAEELAHPVLSTRRNLIVIADEAHRSQYGFTSGYARYLADALPTALRLGFTGTPISFAGADTVEVFGDYIHTYDIRQSQLDGITVPIYYEPRQVKLHLTATDLDAALSEIAAGADVDELEQRKKSRWAALAKAAGAADRVHTLARDQLAHFRERSEGLAGKGMVVCMTRENCVRLYDALTALSGCPEVRVVMTGDLTTDPAVWSVAGHITTKVQRDAIKQRMVDLDDPLRLVIVCDMWLTGTDIPCLHTLYIDKPMRGHTMIQAISRVNRVFRDKPHGLVVDYIGIGEELREATATYARGGGEGEIAPAVSERAKPLFADALREVRGILPPGHEWGDWRSLSRIAYEDRCSLVYGYLTELPERRDHFLAAEHRLSQAFLLVRHLDDCRPHADEVAFFQLARKQLLKLKGERPPLDLDSAVRDLIDESVASEGVVDIFAAAGIDHADISILDEEFLQTFKDRPLPNLRLQLLEQLVRQELDRAARRNLAQAKSFQALLEETLRKYHNRLLDAAAVIRTMIEIRRGLEARGKRAADLGLLPEEVAFYDAIVESSSGVYDDPFLRALVHEMVQAIKANLKVDWTEPHREDVKAGVRAAVKRVLVARGVKPTDFERIVPFVMQQAEVLYRDWPLAA